MKIGQKVRYKPFEGIKDVGGELRIEVTGEVVYINEEKRWFTARQENGIKTGFHFSDIGRNVRLVG